MIDNAQSASQARRLYFNSTWWSRTLGLPENMEKRKIAPGQLSKTSELLEVGLPPSSLSIQTRVLGGDFCDHVKMVGRHTALARVVSAEPQT